MIRKEVDMKTIGKCIVCQDPIYDFQANFHRGCVVQEIIKAIEELTGDQELITALKDRVADIFVTYEQ